MLNYRRQDRVQFVTKSMFPHLVYHILSLVCISIAHYTLGCFEYLFATEKIIWTVKFLSTLLVRVLVGKSTSNVAMNLKRLLLAFILPDEVVIHIVVLLLIVTLSHLLIYRTKHSHSTFSLSSY